MGEIADDMIDRLFERDPFDDLDDDFDMGRGFFGRRRRSGPAPEFNDLCQRCHARIKLKGYGPGTYKPYDLDGSIHSCNTTASIDEFPEFS